MSLQTARSFFGERQALTIFIAAIAMGLSAMIYLYQQDIYSLIYYGDSSYHLFSAKRFVDSVEPGICRFAPEESSEGCGEGTVMVNGVCQVAKTSGTSMAIEPMYIVIAAVAVGGVAVGALFALKRGSGTPKPAREELEEYESKYVARKPAEKKETSSSCSNCGTSLKPTAKFCGSCGTPVS